MKNNLRMLRSKGNSALVALLVILFLENPLPHSSSELLIPKFRKNQSWYLGINREKNFRDVELHGKFCSGNIIRYLDFIYSPTLYFLVSYYPKNYFERIKLHFFRNTNFLKEITANNLMPQTHS